MTRKKAEKRMTGKQEKKDVYAFDASAGAVRRITVQSEFGIKSEKVRRLVGLILKWSVLIPAILFVVTVVLVVNSNRKLKTYGECTGSIIGFYESIALGSGVSDSNKRISPVVSYTVDGKEYQFIGNYFSTNMKTGQEIKVMYHKAEPEKATIREGLYVAPMILGVLTLTFTVAYIICMVLMRKGMLHI